jgi:uncharacterized metal-binding protein YceD (DUF177 family)
MHINVRDFLSESVGFSRAYKIAGERPKLETIQLTKDIKGELTIARLETALLVKGHIETETSQVCDRCLRTFSRPAKVKFEQLFSESPGDDEMPIIGYEIDLAPLVEQEILLGLPIKLLHSPTCEGQQAASKYTKRDATSRLADQARITKGTKRGRT